MRFFSCLFRRHTPVPDEVRFSARDGQVLVSFLASPSLHAELLASAGAAAQGDVSRYMRACLRLALPVLVSHPTLRDDLGRRPRHEDGRPVAFWVSDQMHDHLLQTSQAQKSLLFRAAAAFGNTYFSAHPEHLDTVGGEI